MRVMGVDFGRVNIGIAVGELEAEVASPRTRLLATGTLAKDAIAISKLAQDEEVDQIVIGIPEFEDGKAARICRMLADRIREQGWIVNEVDEQLSTAETHEHLKGMGYTAAQRKKQIDSESACQILYRFFKEQKN
ncbi:MAG: Holliday junction resolvase RuvX [Armatimonadetes bacterium]|nr:Holliday junction resolvase RuvX [Armatimonadota bacterium]